MEAQGKTPIALGLDIRALKPRRRMCTKLCILPLSSRSNARWPIYFGEHKMHHGKMRDRLLRKKPFEPSDSLIATFESTSWVYADEQSYFEKASAR